MKTFPVGLDVLLATGSYVFADLYDFTLQDGTHLRYTTADRDISYAGNTYTSQGPYFDQVSSPSRGHWKSGLDVATWQVTIAPSVADPVTGAAFPAKIYNQPWLVAARIGALDGATVEIHRAYWPSWPSWSPLTLVDFVGYVPATYNLMDSGQDFRPGLFGLHAAFSHTWAVTNASITTGVLSPAHNLTAQKLVEGSSNSAHNVYVGDSDGAPGVNTSYLSVNQMDGVIWRLACIAQPAERTRIVLNIAAGFGGGPPTISVGFDLAGVRTGYSNVAGAGWTILATNIQSIGAGWCLCTIDFTFATANPTIKRQPTPYISLDNGSGTAANSTTYTGNGTSGVNLWWFNLLPRGAWSLSQQAFFDDFNSISTIDMSDTRAPGFNWYRHNDWPNNSMYQAGNTNWFRSAATPTGYISESNSILTLSSDISTYGSGLITAATASNPAGYVGQAWPLSFLAEIKAGWDWNIGTFSTTAFWAAAMEELVGTAPLNSRYAELDFYEGGTGNVGSEPFGPGSAFHSFKIESSVGNVQSQIVPAGGGSDATTTRHLYGSIWLGPADNDGVWGLRINFFNGVMTRNGDGHWSAIAAYNATDSGLRPFGMWKEANYQNFPIIIGAGLNRPMTMDWVRVYNNPNAPPVLYNTSVSLSGSTGTLVTSATQSGGTLYWVATSNGTIPTVAQIKAGQTAASVAAFASGSQAISTTGVQPSISISGFTAGLYTFLVQDNSGIISNIDGADKLPYVGIGDIVGGVVGYWSLRAVSSGSIGNNVVRLRESGGNTEQDFVSIAGGGLDLAAIAAFKGANTLFVRKLYDQSGNGYDMGQSVQANQPIFTLNAFGGLPGITYVAATPTFLELTSAPGSAAANTPPFAVSAVVKPNGIGSFVEGVYGTNGGSGVAIDINVSGTLVFVKSFVATILTSSGTLTNNVTSDFMLTYDGTNSKFYIKGVASGTASIVQTFNTSTTLSLGIEAGFGGGKLDGVMPETMFWSTTRDATQSSNISANQRSYWGYS